MKKGLTELVFILDRSGSMCGLESDTIGGFNALLAKQKKEPGEALITTVLFDDCYEILHDRIAINGVKPITEKEYFVRGCTSLLDAVGKTIAKIANAHKNTIETERPEKVLCVITTDGLENSSREYSYAQIKKMIELEEKKYGWEFIFLGANIDAAAEAEKMGISKSRAANYKCDSKGTKLNFRVLNDAVSNLRASSTISDDWKNEIYKDYKNRK